MKIEAEKRGENCGLLRFGPWVLEVTQRKNCARKSCIVHMFCFLERERKPSSNKYIWRENFLMMIAIKEVTPQKINLTKPPMRPTPWTNYTRKFSEIPIYELVQKLHACRYWYVVVLWCCRDIFGKKCSHRPK